MTLDELKSNVEQLHNELVEAVNYDQEPGQRIDLFKAWGEVLTEWRKIKTKRWKTNRFKTE